MSIEIPSLEVLKQTYLQWMRMRNNSPRTLELWEYTLRRFLVWCEQREITCVTQVTADMVAAYRRHLFHYRNANTNQSLKFATQASYLMSIRRWFVWLEQEGFISTNPAASLELPKEEHRLPTGTLTADEVETVMASVDLTRPLGLRNRAILETFYSTAIRAGELTNLEVYDLDADRGVVTIRQGKGRKDRVVPIGQRALSWVGKYVLDLRPTLVDRTNSTTLFVSCNGKPFGRNNVSAIVKGYLKAADIRHRGSCHLFRHTAATLMMENGADLRSLQQYLGHARLNTTQIYTHVSIKRLQEVHRRTHPAKPNETRNANDNSQPKDKKE